MSLVAELLISYVRSSNDHLVRRFPFAYLPKRWMTRSRRVQDRSRKKRVHDLEIATEKWKVASKVLFVMDVLKKEPEQVIPLRSMEKYRQQLGLEEAHKVSEFIRKSPKLFEIFRDKNGALWCGLSKQVGNFVSEEAQLIENHQEKAAEYVSRMLMMSVNKRLSLDKIVHFRRDLGLPYNFRDHWIHMFPKNFRQVVIDGTEHLELVSWNPDWAVTELERHVLPDIGVNPPMPGMLSLPFPSQFPRDFKTRFHLTEKVNQFQKTQYLSPYADARDLVPGSIQFDKRAIAIVHELLSFTIERQLVTDHLTHFRREFALPQKLMRLLLKHFGIFYVSERGKRFHVFLKEAYEGSELKVKTPLALWKEELLKLTGYRGRKRGVRYINEFSDLGTHCIVNDKIPIVDLESRCSS